MRSYGQTSPNLTAVHADGMTVGIRHANEKTMDAMEETRMKGRHPAGVCHLDGSPCGCSVYCMFARKGEACAKHIRNGTSNGNETCVACRWQKTPACRFDCMRRSAKERARRDETRRVARMA
jgi:hypothetical protein